MSGFKVAETGDLITNTHNNSPKRGDLMVKLTERHKQIAVLAAAGVMKKEISERVRVHPNTVTRVLKNPFVREMIDEMQRTVQQETFTNLVEAFDEAVPAAFRQLVELMQGGPPAVSFRASESILNRSQVAPKREIHARHEVGGGVVHVHIPASKLMEFNEIALEAGEPLGLPTIRDGEEMVVEIDRKTGEVISETVAKV